MRRILAIDPAWTNHKPSGVAVVREARGRWDCVGLAPSYNQFVELSNGVPVNWSSVAVGTTPDVDALLGAAERLGGGQVDLITVDMPLALTPISSAEGGRRRHLPSVWRPRV